MSKKSGKRVLNGPDSKKGLPKSQGGVEPYRFGPSGGSSSMKANKLLMEQAKMESNRGNCGLS